MTTPEQQAREMLERMGVENAHAMSYRHVSELETLIAENLALKAELEAIKGAGEPVRVPLTDERISSMLVTTDGFTERERKIIKIVARATEAAHGIKGAKP